MSDERCPHDHRQLLDELRRLPTPALGRLARPVLERVLAGDDSLAARESLRLLGEVLRDRKRRKAA